MAFRQNSMVWVWDSTGLPAVVVQHAPMGCALVRLDHGVTFNVTMADLLPRYPHAAAETSLQRRGSLDPSWTTTKGGKDTEKSWASASTRINSKPLDSASFIAHLRTVPRLTEMTLRPSILHATHVI